MDAATLAVIRAARPTFRSCADKLAYAVHAYLLVQGLKLVAAGQAAEDEGQDFAAQREEVGSEGWDDLDGAYAFRYQDTDDQRPSLYVKCLAVGPKMLVHWAAGGGGSGGGAAAEEAASAPLELDVIRFTTDAASVAESYQHMDELVKQLQQGMAAVLARPDAAAASGRAAAEQRIGSNEAGTSGQQQRSQPGEEVEPPVHPLQEGPPRHDGGSGIGYEPPRWPGSGIGVGGDDLVPPGLRPPGIGPFSGGPLGGLVGGPPGLGGGGMHVGPHHPVFGPGRIGGTVGGGLGGIPPNDLPPGARWDPIAPPGLPGFRPGDFRPEREGRGGPRPPVHPDVMQPGAGGGGDDFDSMFG